MDPSVSRLRMMETALSCNISKPHRPHGVRAAKASAIEFKVTTIARFTTSPYAGFGYRWKSKSDAFVAPTPPVSTRFFVSAYSPSYACPRRIELKPNSKKSFCSPATSTLLSSVAFAPRSYWAVEPISGHEIPIIVQKRELDSALFFCGKVRVGPMISPISRRCVPQNDR